MLELIADFRKELDKRTIGPRGRQVLDHLMPHLLSDVCSREDAPVPLSRLTPLLTGIITRTTYLELLSRIPRCAEASDFVVRGIADGRQPACALSDPAG